MTSFSSKVMIIATEIFPSPSPYVAPSDSKLLCLVMNPEILATKVVTKTENHKKSRAI